METTVTDAEASKWAPDIQEALRELSYGEVKVVVQQGQIVELLVTKKRRKPKN